MVVGDICVGDGGGSQAGGGFRRDIPGNGAVLSRLALLDLGKLNLRLGERERPMEGDGGLNADCVGVSPAGLGGPSILGPRGGVTETLGRVTFKVVYRTIIKISWHWVAKYPHIRALCVIRTCSVDCAASGAVLGTVSNKEALALRVCFGLACQEGFAGS